MLTSALDAGFFSKVFKIIVNGHSPTFTNAVLVNGKSAQLEFSLPIPFQLVIKDFLGQNHIFHTIKFSIHKVVKIVIVIDIES